MLTLYAGPAAGDYLADHMDDMFGFPLGMLSGGDLCVPDVTDELDGMDDTDGMEDGDDSAPYDGDCGGDEPSSAISEDLKEQLREFEGMAATLRFDDGSIELESAGDGTVASAFMFSSGGTADVVTSLPSDTAAAYGLGFADGWFSDLVDYVAPYTGQSADELMDMLSEESGLDLPGDAETLAGDSVAVALGSDFDPEALFSADDPSDVPVAVKIQGDPDEIEKVLDKLREMAGAEADVLASDSDGDIIVIGPNDDYRSEVLKDGDLGDDDVFKDVVRESDQASTILFVNFNSFEDAIAEIAGDDDEFLDNLKPLSGFGITGWVDGDTAHAVVRLTTD